MYFLGGVSLRLGGWFQGVRHASALICSLVPSRSTIIFSGLRVSDLGFIEPVLG